MHVPREYLVFGGVFAVMLCVLAVRGFWPFVNFMLRVMQECPKCHMLSLQLDEQLTLVKTSKGLRVKSVWVEYCSNPLCRDSHIESVSYRKPRRGEVEALPREESLYVVL